MSSAMKLTGPDHIPLALESSAASNENAEWALTPLITDVPATTLTLRIEQECDGESGKDPELEIRLMASITGRHATQTRSHSCPAQLRFLHESAGESWYISKSCRLGDSVSNPQSIWTQDHTNGKISVYICRLSSRSVCKSVLCRRQLRKERKHI